MYLLVSRSPLALRLPYTGVVFPICRGSCHGCEPGRTGLNSHAFCFELAVLRRHPKNTFPPILRFTSTSVVRPLSITSCSLSRPAGRKYSEFWNTSRGGVFTHPVGFLLLFFTRPLDRATVAPRGDAASMSTGEIVAIVEDRCLDDPIYKRPDGDGDGDVGVGSGAAAARHPADPAFASGTVTLVKMEACCVSGRWKMGGVVGRGAGFTSSSDVT